ncbi:MAG TPA: hypothetical protein VFV96_06035 [Verrucomicrobiae bacterium]|nr:hypothetical protein [Verrucomicrobiae bacterium]
MVDHNVLPGAGLDPQGGPAGVRKQEFVGGLRNASDRSPDDQDGHPARPARTVERSEGSRLNPCGQYDECRIFRGDLDGHQFEAA